MMTPIQRRGLMALEDPTTVDEVVSLMAWFHEVFDGGFHPEDRAESIVNTFGPVFDDETGKQYNELMDAVWSVCDEAGVDPCEIALQAAGVELAE